MSFYNHACSVLLLKSLTATGMQDSEEFKSKATHFILFNLVLSMYLAMEIFMIEFLELFRRIPFQRRLSLRKTVRQSGCESCLKCTAWAYTPGMPRTLSVIEVCYSSCAQCFTSSSAK